MPELLDNKLRHIIAEVFADRVLSKEEPNTKDVLFDILAQLWVIWHDKNPPEDFDEHMQFCIDIQKCVSLLTKEVKYE